MSEGMKRIVCVVSMALCIGVAAGAGPVTDYLSDNPNVAEWLVLETESPGVYLGYAYWPQAWVDRLEEMVVCFANDAPLPYSIPVELAPQGTVFPSAAGYATLDLGRDVYLAHVGHMIYLDMIGALPWSLAAHTDEELSYLLPSSNFFVLNEYAGVLRYQTTMGPNGQDAGGILGDPRDTLAFLLAEPEQGYAILGTSPEHTAANLSEWFHDYLYHWNLDSPQEPMAFFQQYPYFADRICRLPTEAFGDVYVSIVGCWSASSLFAQLLRAVNIPSQATTLALEDAYAVGNHRGLMVSLGGDRRYVPHSDDLYTGWLQGARPLSPWQSIGWALWDNVWLVESDFLSLTTPPVDPDTIGQMSFEDHNRYLAEASWYMHTYEWWMFVRSYLSYAGCGFDDVGGAVIFGLQDQLSLSEAEAERWWSQMRDVMAFYGDDACEACGAIEGYQQQWCGRTGRCDENGYPDR
ncbi:MAG: hypothetical protein WBC63_08600 [Candidatus Bipolaricaulia bacterium]